MPKIDAPKIKMAPDGGPLSQLHKAPNFKVMKVKTLKVIFKKDKERGPVVINKKAYDPQIHELFKEDKKQRMTLKPDVKSPVFGKEQEEELLTYSMEKLKSLVEFSLIEKPSSKKNELVSQILKIRKEE